MIIVLIFMIIVVSALMAGYFVVLPLSSFNTAAINQIDTKIDNIAEYSIKSDFADDNNLADNKEKLDWTNDNINLQNNINLTDDDKNKLGLLSEINIKNIKTNNIIDNKIVNLNKFGIEFQLIPLTDMDEFKIYTTDSVNSVIAKMYVYKIGSDINIIKGTGNNISIDKEKAIGIYSIVGDQNGINGNVVDTNMSGSDNFVKITNLSGGNEFYYKDKGYFFNKEISIKPFYNLDDTGKIIKRSNAPLFYPKYMYLIKLYFNLDKNKIDNFRIYIPDGKYITLNNIEEITKMKKGKKFYINKVKIIKNGLINKIEESKYGF